MRRLLPLLLAAAAADCGGNADAPPAVVFGALIPQYTTFQEDFEALRFAADDVNQSGVFDRPWKVVPLQYLNAAERPGLVEQLISREGAIGILANRSSASVDLIRATNGAHPNVVGCSGSATSPLLNQPGTPDGPDGINADKNGTYYRTISDDRAQARLLWHLLPDKAHAALYWVDESYGQGLAKALRAEAAAAGAAFVFDKAFAGDGFTLAAAQPDIDAVLALNKSGAVTTLVLVGEPEQNGAILNALVKTPGAFHGTLIGSDGLLSADTFASSGADLGTWVAGAGNSAFAVTPDMVEGANSSAWTARFAARSPGWDPSGTTAPASADCGYAFAIALMYAQDEGRHGGAALVSGLQRLGAGALTGADVVTVGPSADGMRAAQAAITAGKRVRLDGASGVVEFDALGDRVAQPYETWTLRHGTTFEWVADEVWDAHSLQCIKHCHP